METRGLTDLRARKVMAESHLAIARDLRARAEDEVFEALSVLQSIGRAICDMERGSPVANSPHPFEDPRYGDDRNVSMGIGFPGLI